MVKNYVLDTNVLLQSPEALFSFEDNTVVIPVVVLEELDNMKKAEGETGANARKTIRSIEKLRLTGDLLKGVPLPEKGKIIIEKNFVDVELPPDLPEAKADNRILKVCKGLSDSKRNKVVLVTKDIVLRIKAQIIGIKAEDFEREQVKADPSYTGRREVYVPDECLKDMKKGGIPVSFAYESDKNGEKSVPDLCENEFILLKSELSEKKTRLGRVENGVIKKLEYQKAIPYGVIPRNLGMTFLQEALMQPAEKAPLVIAKGMAGTGKTFYALAVGLEKILNHPTGEYRRILICRPNSQFDDDIGFLPGDEEEKIAPLMRPVTDNLEQLLDSNEKHRYDSEAELKDKVAEIFDRGIIKTEALNFIRGRSIVNTYLIIDEAQNMTPGQVKGIITRAGIGTKIILLGDPNQIDRPFLDERTNGLSYACEHMKGSPLCWQITLGAEECVRSALAVDAVKRL